MKRNAAALVLLLAVTMTLCIFSATWKSDQAFRYPELSAFNSSTARKRACYVPEETVQNMTTRALAETVLTYPFLMDMFAFDSPDLWFRQVQDLPMFRELLAREDGVKMLEIEAAKEQDTIRQMDYYNLIACIKRAQQS